MAVAKTLRAILLGDPPIQDHQPDAYELYQKLQEIEVQAALNGALYFEDTLAQLNAVSGAVEGDTGFVIDDSTPANDGVYRRGASTWVKTAELPGAFSDSLGAIAQLDLLEASIGDLAYLDQVAAAQMADNAVTNAKLADMAAASIKGRAEGAGTGDPQDLTGAQVSAIIGLDDEITAREAADNLGDIIRLSSVTGTANAATGAVQAAQAHIAITGRQRIQSLWPTTNTATNPTLTIGATAYTIKRRDGSALAAGDLRGGAVYDFVLDPDAVNTLRLMGAVSAWDIGLGNVDNTADLDKPVSTAQAAAIQVEKTRAMNAEWDLKSRDVVADSAFLASETQYGPATLSNVGDIDGTQGDGIRFAYNQSLPQGWPRQIILKYTSGPTIRVFIGPSTPVTTITPAVVIEKSAAGLASGDVVTLNAGVDFVPFEITGPGWTLGYDSGAGGARIATIPETGAPLYMRSAPDQSPAVAGQTASTTGSAANLRIQMQVIVTAYPEIKSILNLSTTSSVPFRDIVRKAASTSRGLLQADGSYFTQPNAVVTGLMTAYPGMTIEATLQPIWAGQGGPYAFVVFYDAAMAVVGAGIIPAKTSNDDVSRTASVVTPETARYMRLAGYGYVGPTVATLWPGLGYGFTESRDNLHRDWVRDVWEAYAEKNQQVFVGDSIAQGLSNIARDYTPLGENWRYINLATGGENVLDTGLDIGTVPLKVRGPVTLPGDGSLVTLSAVWGFKDTVTIASNGTYTQVGKTASGMQAGTDHLHHVGNVPVILRVTPGADGASVFQMKLAYTGSPVTFPGDFAVGCRIRTYADGTWELFRPSDDAVGVIMMGTNGQFEGVGGANPTPYDLASADRLVELQRKAAACFRSGKFVTVGYYFGGTGSPTAGLATQKTWRDYYEAEMHREFGPRFFAARRYLITSAAAETGVTLTTAEIAQIVDAGDVPTVFRPDGTHPSTFMYQVLENKINEIAYNNGDIPDYTPIPIVLVTGITVAAVSPSIAVGAATALTVTPTNSGITVGADKVVAAVSSNPAVATVSVNAGTGLVTVTGVSVGAATITVTCRHGGASGTVNITVT